MLAAPLEQQVLRRERWSEEVVQATWFLHYDVPIPLTLLTTKGSRRATFLSRGSQSRKLLSDDLPKSSSTSGNGKSATPRSELVTVFAGT